MGIFRKAAEAAVGTVIAAADAPRTVRQAIDRRDRENYAHGDLAKDVRKADKAARRNR